MSNEDKFPIRVVVMALAFVVVGGAAAMAFLASTQTPIPDQLDRVVSIALGAIAGILAKTSTTMGNQPVEVVNDATQPVPVDAVPTGD